ncbi:MAG: metal-dependent transcriptional regulator [Candidatus Marinimicrobia bacterium]|nr:metal-dependent transcriptional regulator [Candidatus Neomarinimicrobiota bacterium]
METNWQNIEDGNLKHSSVHHLMAISQLCDTLGYARTTDISNVLNITRGSVSITLNKLNENDYVVFDNNKHIKLTEKGLAVVQDVLEKRKAVKKFFIQCLQMEATQADECACKLEHVMSDDVVARLTNFSNFFSQKIATSELIQRLKIELDK